MPTITSSTSPAVTDLAAAITSQLATGGNAARAVIGDRSTAFDWAGGGTPSPLGVFASALVEGLTYRATIVAPSATPARKVAAGTVKPNAATITTTTETLPKYSGYSDVYLEGLLDTDGLVPAIENVIFDQCVAAFSVDVGLELAGAALTADGVTWADAILAGIATLPSADILVISPSDLAAIVSPSAGFQVALSDAIPVVFGLGMIALPGLATGRAFVMKSSALCVFDSRLSPAVLVDPYSQSSNNIVRVVCDMFAAAQLVAPGAAVAVSPTGP